MECPECEEELNYHDYYTGKAASFYGTAGNGIFYPESQFKKLGDIYKCTNEECECFDGHFYTDEQDNLHQGYPC